MTSAATALPTPPHTPAEVMSRKPARPAALPTLTSWPNVLTPSSSALAPAPTPGAATAALPVPAAPRVLRREDWNTTSRQLSDNELSYYLPSRGDGVNDMYVHHDVQAVPSALAHARVRLAWALALVRHPLLASSVCMRGYDDVAFVHRAPATVDAALADADARLLYLDDPSHTSLELVDAYLNGPRTLGDQRLALLVVRPGTQRTADQTGPAAAPPQSAADKLRNEEQAAGAAMGASQGTLVSPAAARLGGATGPSATNVQPNPIEPNTNLGAPNGANASDSVGMHEVMFCTTHFLGDGMALHTFMDELYGLLASDVPDAGLRDQLAAALAAAAPAVLPPSLEEQLRLSPLQIAVGEVAQRTADARLLGGQTLPAARGRQRHTVVPTLVFSREDTKRALAQCKAHGVTIASVVFALCAVAWSAKCRDQKEPIMIYSALNLRPHLSRARATAPGGGGGGGSFFHLAIGYFNVVLPSIVVRSLSLAELVWYRAQQTQTQTRAAVRSPLAPALFRATAMARAARSLHWAPIDDAAAAARAKEDKDTAAAAARAETNPGLGLGITLPYREEPQPVAPAALAPAAARRPAPPPPTGRALMGVSMLGNLDGIYAHREGLELLSLTTGSRQRAGGLLLFSYTLAGKLWISLGYDRNGFADGAIDAFWADVLVLARGVLLGEATADRPSKR